MQAGVATQGAASSARADVRTRPAPPRTRQAANFEFFLAAGTSVPPLLAAAGGGGGSGAAAVHWSVVVSGDNCSPCQALRAGDALPAREGADLARRGIREAWCGGVWPDI
jgi:hypothetical protein